ncbi:MAG: DUF4340 domain-containing protein [Candidatus Scalindua sp. AMX11]|nr:MAG: DUF4340 domain-containing protein [Candidatus Scalindua sp.]NOG82346.1 DUF4340 domain-containing protein [Planctomycetota bacterium]RZV66913.1 MAG: DUF4340 domain-containing protein [Candidatus Scalindua sp. SCAELEC01]TDE63263.1 MAG: DUF4340 domain-containing protein [Candidatus Scalindua sp. AMX11]GJQ60551.1 MAG: hypothetical protein SCALA701_33520 [Candidatus Scalindua sp.]
MKFKTTIILFIVAVIGVCYIFLYERKQFRTEELHQRKQMVLPDYKVTQIRKIEIRKEAESIVLENVEEDHWRLLEPLDVRADVAEVNNILSQFEFLKKMGTLKGSEIEGFDRKDYGLDKPKIVINLWRNKGVLKTEGTELGNESKYTIYVGDKIAAGQNNVYISVEGESDIYVVLSSLLEKITKDVNDLRNKWVFEFDEAAVERIKIVNTSEESIVCSREENLWWMSEPVTDRADSQRIKGIINELKNLKLAKADFVSDTESDIAKCGLDKPILTVSIGFQDKVQTLLLGNSLDQKVYAKRRDESAIFFVHDVVIDDMDLESNDLRDRQFLRFESIGSYGIEQLKFEYPDELVTIDKTAQYDWLIKSPTEILGDGEVIRGFVEKIKELQIQEFVDDSGENLGKYGLDQPAVSVSVFRKMGEGETVKFYVGKTDEHGGLCYVARADNNAVFSVPTEDFYDIVTGGLLTLRDKLVVEFPKEKATELVVERDGETFVCQKEEGIIEKWFLTSPVTVEADVDSVNQIVWNLAFLKADKFFGVYGEDLSAYGLDKPTVKVSVTYEESNGVLGSERGGTEGVAETKPVTSNQITKTLLVGDKLEPSLDKSSYYAKLADDDLVFQIGWSDMRDYRVDLVSKILFDFDVTKANMLKIKSLERETVLKRDDENRWIVDQPEEKTVKGNYVDNILLTMNSLEADSIVEYASSNLSLYELEEPQFRMTVGLENGENSMLVGKKTESYYFVMNEALSYVYLVRKNKLEELMSITQSLIEQ